MANSITEILCSDLEKIVLKGKNTLEEGDWDDQGSYVGILKNLGAFWQKGRKHIKWS